MKEEEKGRQELQSCVSQVLAVLSEEQTQKPFCPSHLIRAV